MNNYRIKMHSGDIYLIKTEKDIGELATNIGKSLPWVISETVVINGIFIESIEKMSELTKHTPLIEFHTLTN